MYDTDGICSTNSGDYTYSTGVSMLQTTEANNGKWICLWGQDDIGNSTTLASANDINIDATAPMIIFTGATPASGATIS